jgi:hypothetical protein
MHMLVAPPEQQHVARQQPAQHAYGGLKDMHARIYVKLYVAPQELHRVGDVCLAVHELQGSSSGWGEGPAG